MFKNVNGVNVPMTVQEIAAREAEVAAAALPQVPKEVQKWAAEIALIEAGMETLPSTYFNGIPAGKERKKAQSLWDKRPTLRRDSPILSAAIAAGTVTAAQVDALMISAKTLEQTTP